MSERKVYGPYLRKDGRKHVILIQGKTRRTVSYPRFLVEEFLGRVLSPEETVDHIDRDFTNNDLDNLRVVPRSKHISEDVLRAKVITKPCVRCSKSVETNAGKINRARKLGKAHPFCSKSCSGVYGTNVQNGYSEKKASPEKAEYEYYYPDKGSEGKIT
jgi:hypothetical protein